MRTILFTLGAFAVLSSPAHAGEFTLASASFAAGATLANTHVYDKYGCRGRNASPELHWSGAPSGAKSFALTVFDPDAPAAGGWWHWLVFDIDASATSLPAGAGDAASGGAPHGAVSATNSFGEIGYGGPCPPPGDAPHRYVFTIYALKSAHLGLASGAAPASVKRAIERDALASASIQARYGR